jgi:hypothetical protein
MSAGPKSKGSRADHDFFDFNRSQHERAAESVTIEQLRDLFEALDRADEQFGAINGDDRTPTLEALKAVVEFLAQSPMNENGRFSRPFELLISELRNRPAAKGSILPAEGSGSRAVNGRASTHHVKAAAAFATEFLRAHAKMGVAEAAGEITNVLSARNFSFGKHRSDKAAAIKAWRRDYPRDRDNSRAALIFRTYCKTPPVTVSGDAARDRAAVIRWLGGLLGRAGYGSVL